MTYTSSLVSVTVIATSLMSAVAAFSSSPAIGPTIPINPSTSLFMAKRKMSMAEKRKRRHAKQRLQRNPAENMSPSKLDFKSTPKEKDDDDEPQHFQDPSAAAEKAKEILKSQRESVDMLTMVREKIEGLPKHDILTALEEDGPGFYFRDGLLGEEMAATLCAEARSLYENDKMAADTGNLGSGEYIVSIKGGKEQYMDCPRSIELVVSATKHLPDVLEGSMNLDGSACMATMRGFDYKALKASVALLLGSEDEDIDYGSNNRSYGTVTDADGKDQRRLTVFYYLVPETWDESCGGGLIFQEGNTVVVPKQDRLVLWKSDSTLFQKEAWKGGGSESNAFGSCLELHLVASKDTTK